MSNHSSEEVDEIREIYNFNVEISPLFILMIVLK
jgi:hypothetical protein